MSRQPLFPPVFAPTVSRPMVDDFSLRAARMLQRQQPAGVPPVYPLPMRSNPIWSGSNELGSEVAFAPDSNNRQMVLKLEEWGPPKIWTVALGLNFDPALTPNPAFRITATIQFGVGGVVQQVEIDWKQGATITLPANTLVITATYDIPSTFPALAVPSDLVLRASLSHQPSTNAQPTRSYFSSFLTTDSFVHVPVPPFAKSVSFGFTASTVPFFTLYTSMFVRFSNATPVVNGAFCVYPATQLLSFIDFTNQLLGAPQRLSVPEGARSAGFIWAPGGIPGSPPNNFSFLTQFDIGL